MTTLRTMDKDNIRQAPESRCCFSPPRGAAEPSQHAPTETGGACGLDLRALDQGGPRPQNRGRESLPVLWQYSDSTLAVL